MTDRIPCCVPHCGRTTKRDAVEGIPGFSTQYVEWICQPCWKRVPAAYKMIYRRAKAKCRRTQSSRNVERAARIWRKCKQKAMPV